MHGKNGSTIEHFNRIASSYRNLRITDSDPVEYLAEIISGDNHDILLIDIGCGTGRYTEALLNHLTVPINLYCLDLNKRMLAICKEILADHANAKTSCFLRGIADSISFKDNIFDYVLAFNAVHHFDIPKFLAEASRTLKNGGVLGIYTRSRDQKDKTIWGKYFPEFAKRENRLLSVNEFKSVIEKYPSLALEEIKTYNFKRSNSISELRALVSRHHYSTFEFYSPAELKNVTQVFARRLRRRFNNPNRIYHRSGYTLLLIKNTIY